MENRIKIGDVWYVREDAIRDPLDHLENEEIEMNVTTFDGRVFENNPESMVEAREMFCERGIIEFRIFIRDLVNENWIKKN